MIPLTSLRTPLEELLDQQLVLRCVCGWAGRVLVRHLAAEFRSGTPVAAILRRMRCRRCGRPVERLEEALLEPALPATCRDVEAVFEEMDRTA